MYLGIFGDFQLLLQRVMARTTTADFRKISSRAQSLGDHLRDHDPRQPRARQRPLAAQHLHLQSQNFQSENFKICFCIESRGEFLWGFQQIVLSVYLEK